MIPHQDKNPSHEYTFLSPGNSVPIFSQFRIALLACYFGPLPPYSALVFKSMGENPGIDWLLVTDSLPNYDLPPNVHLHLITLQSLAERSSMICGFPVTIPKPYDICSLRPAYGLIFQDELMGYDFWGHVDLDVIFGNILKFIPDATLSTHDRILCRGALSIYRNIERVNHAFKLQAPGAMDYRIVFSDLSSRPFLDEWRGIWKILRYHEFRQFHDEFIADIKPPSRYKITRFESEELINYPHQFYYWHTGRCFHGYYHREGGFFDREIAYIHFQKRNLPKPAFNEKTTSGFSIGPCGFLPYSRENLTEDEMDALNPERWKPLSTILQEQKKKLLRKCLKAKKLFF